MVSTPPTWRTSSRCNGVGADCIQVASAPGLGLAGFRDSKRGDGGPELWFSQANALAFTAAVRNGQFD